MERDYEKLVLEPRGPAYVLSRTDSHGITTELVLSELNVMFLGRLAPQIAREISASKVPAGSGVSALVPIPVHQYEAGCDVHQQVIVLRFRDRSEGVFDFSFDPAGARQVAGALMAWADKADHAAKPTRQ
jgi:hypothetical protein